MDRNENVIKLLTIFSIIYSLVYIGPVDEIIQLIVDFGIKVE